MQHVSMFPDSGADRVDIQDGTFYTNMNIWFKSHDQLNIFLTEAEMMDLLHQIDAARDRWLAQAAERKENEIADSIPQGEADVNE